MDGKRMNEDRVCFLDFAFLYACSNYLCVVIVGRGRGGVVVVAATTSTGSSNGS